MIPTPVLKGSGLDVKKENSITSTKLRKKSFRSGFPLLSPSRVHLAVAHLVSFPKKKVFRTLHGREVDGGKNPRKSELGQGERHEFKWSDYNNVKNVNNSTCPRRGNEETQEHIDCDCFVCLSDSSWKRDDY